MSPLNTESYPCLGATLEAVAGGREQLLEVTDSPGKGLSPAFSRTGHPTPHLCPVLQGKNPWGQLCLSSGPVGCPVGGAAEYRVDTAFPAYRCAVPEASPEPSASLGPLGSRAYVLSVSLAARRGTYGFWASIQTLNGPCLAPHNDRDFPSLSWRSHGLSLSQQQLFGQQVVVLAMP